MKLYNNNNNNINNNNNFQILEQDSLAEKGLDIYAFILFKESRFDTLGELYHSFIPQAEYTFTHWVAWGYMYYSEKKYPKALLYSHKVCYNLFTKSIQCFKGSFCERIDNWLFLCDFSTSSMSIKYLNINYEKNLTNSIINYLSTTNKNEFDISEKFGRY